MKVKSGSEVAQSCPTLSDPMDCSPPGCSVHGIFQARVLEWGAIALQADSLLSLERLNRPETILPTTLVCGKTVFHETGPWCQKGGGPLIPRSMARDAKCSAVNRIALPHSRSNSSPTKKHCGHLIFSLLEIIGPPPPAHMSGIIFPWQTGPQAELQTLPHYSALGPM